MSKREVSVTFHKILALSFQETFTLQGQSPKMYFSSLFEDKLFDLITREQQRDIPDTQLGATSAADQEESIFWVCQL